MNRTRITKIYDTNYCTFCRSPVVVVRDPWEVYYLCSCIDAKEFEKLINKSKELREDINAIELNCNMEHLYRKMIQLELF